MEYPPPDPTQALLSLQNVCLDYGQRHALSNVHLTLQRSEIHAMVGEHGAGKSSLAMIMSGLLKPQSGRLLFLGKPYRAFPLKTALKLGIEMVHQHTLSLNTHFSIAENFALDSTPNYKFRSKKKALQAAQRFLRQYDIDLDPTTPVKHFNAADQNFVNILKHIYPHPRLLILDEALEKLSSKAFNTIVRILMTLKQQGMSILLITHRIDDIYTLADRVSIIRHGKVLVTDHVRHLDKLTLIKMAYIQVSAEKHLEANKEFYQFFKYNEAILQNLPVNVIVTDSDNNIKMLNDHCKRSFRFEQTPYLNVQLKDFFSSTNEEVRALIHQAFAFKEENTFYQVPITFNTVQAITNIKTFPIYDGVSLIGNMIILEDISEYDRLQKQLMLSEKLASVGLLAAGVAHEINNPLEIIYTYLSYMKYRFRSPEFHEAIDTLHEQISSISSIVSNLHSFSDNTQRIIEEIDLNSLIRTMLDLIKHSARHKQISIHFEPDASDLWITANTNEIKQVMLNLFKNSFEAMPSGGDIYIKTATIYEQDVECVELTFEDTGCGIGDKDPNNIFLPFYSTKKGQASNLGLGLSVSYGIITKYNGTIHVDNRETSGCRFLITLPQTPSLGGSTNPI